MTLLVSDLDNTLIFSYKKFQDGPCVESKDGKKLSYMTPRAYELLAKANEALTFVPLTTRSRKQYQRIALLADKTPHLALCANGAILLVDGEIDPSWQAETTKLLAGSLAELETARAILADDEAVTLAPEIVDGAFVYCKSQNTAQSISRLLACMDCANVYIDTNGEKLYVLPLFLTKGLALERLQKRLGYTGKVIAAGDSKFDLSMLLRADVALVPQGFGEMDALAEHKQVAVSTKSSAAFAEFVLERALAEKA